MRLSSYYTVYGRLYGVCVCYSAALKQAQGHASRSMSGARAHEPREPRHHRSHPHHHQELVGPVTSPNNNPMGVSFFVLRKNSEHNCAGREQNPHTAAASYYSVVSEKDPERSV
ncbi:unnamed protein product [Danaus chrysippus]|uniref:(African queen) hypothetical protein n=1 Tax=Danaus chrysippus TaxID=151541 RepID=A0A8J2VV52_9NEOP|nr:unnamed protein product [Danaus chrysippus]